MAGANFVDRSTEVCTTICTVLVVVWRGDSKFANQENGQVVIQSIDQDER